MLDVYIKYRSTYPHTEKEKKTIVKALRNLPQPNYDWYFTGMTICFPIRVLYTNEPLSTKVNKWYPTGKWNIIGAQEENGLVQRKCCLRGRNPAGTIFKQFSINMHRNTESILISHRPHRPNNPTIDDELQYCSEVHCFIWKLL